MKLNLKSINVDLIDIYNSTDFNNDLIVMFWRLRG